MLQVLSGHDGGWPANQRGDGRLSLAAAWAAAGWIALTGAAGLAVLVVVLPGLAIWLTPVFAPMLIAPGLIAATSRPATGRLFATPGEAAPSPVVAAYRDIHARWGGVQEAPDRTPTAGDLGAAA